MNLKSLNVVKVLRNKKMRYLTALLFLRWGLPVVHPICVAEQTALQPIHVTISDPH